MLLFLACQPIKIDSAVEDTTTEQNFSVSAEVSSLIPSVVTIQASSVYEGTIITSAFIGDTLLQSKPVFIPAEGSVSFPFLGIPEQTQTTLHFEFRGDETRTGDIEIETGSFSIPAPVLDAFSYTTNDVGYFMGTVFGTPERLVIINTHGDIVWQTQQLDDDHGGIDSRIARDGQSVYFNRFSKDKSIDSGAIHQIQWDGTSIRTIPTPLGHHVFTELPDGTLTFIALDPKDTEQYGPVCGDSIIEIAPDGTYKSIFTTWGVIPLYESDFFSSDFYVQGHDWTHTNFVEYFEATERYLISMASTNMILEIDREGTVYKKIGGQGARGFDYAVENPADIFAYPHAPQWNHRGELLLMSTVGNNSHALAYEIDDETKKLHKTWDYGGAYNYNLRHLGEIQQDESFRLINWSTSGHMELQNPNGEIIWEIYSPLGLWFAQFSYLPALPGMENPQ